jgi:hypothetical protein
MSDAVPTTGFVQLAPNPRALDALGRNHTFQAAIAELVDNSIDAEAKNVLIRFVRDRERIVRLLVADDGSGMDGDRIDIAMTVGGLRSYGVGQIGRFGLGMKAASFSQARSVTVMSAASSNGAIGRRWLLEKAKHDYTCEIVDPTFASVQLNADWGFPTSPTGTLVRWDDLSGFPTAMSGTALDRFLQDAFAKIRTHVGLICHRILERGDLRIVIDVEENEDVVLRTDVPPLNPFGYTRSGATGWPKSIRASDGSRSLNLDCHIWPGRSSADEFRLDGNLIERQGLYIYLNDRLIQTGGWNGLCLPDKQLNLARVGVDITGDVPGLLILRPEKSSVEVGPEFASAILAGSAGDGTTFSDYTVRARGTFKDANQRQRVRPAILPPGSGFPPRLRQVFTREFPVKDDEPVHIRWTRLPLNDFFEVDREQRILWLNDSYRRALSGGRSGSLNDLPMIKALLFLLTENIFAGQNLGPRDKDNIDVWQEILVTAAREECR